MSIKEGGFQTDGWTDLPGRFPTEVCNPTTATAGFADNECTDAPFTPSTGFKNSDRNKTVEFFLEKFAMSKWYWVSTGGMWNSIIGQLEMDFVVGVGTKLVVP